MIVNIILTGGLEPAIPVSADTPMQYEPSQYKKWVTNARWILIDMNDIIYQVQVGTRHFAVLAHHWHQFKSSGYQELWATELHL